MRCPPFAMGGYLLCLVVVAVVDRVLAYFLPRLLEADLPTVKPAQTGINNATDAPHEKRN